MEATEKILEVLNPIYSFNYASGKVPASYCCQKCGKGDVRLWREEGFTTSRKYVLCADCLRLLHTDIEKELEGGLKIGAFVPAVPTEENSFFVGYKHIPIEGMASWKKLPF